MSAYRVPIVGVLLALVLTLGWWLLLYSPASQRQADVEAATAGFRQQQSALRGQIASLRAIEAEEVEIRTALARLEEYIPVGTAQPTTIRQLQRAADRSGVELSSVTFGTPEVPVAAADVAPTDTGDPGTTLANVPLTILLEGGYFQVVDFLRRVEVNVPRAVLMTGVDLAEGAAEGFPTLAATLTGQIFAIVPADDLDEVAPGGQAPDAVPAPAPSPGPAPIPTPGAAASPAPQQGGDDA